MAKVTDIEVYRDGGSIEFCISGTEADGLYQLQTPFLGAPRPLFRDGNKLEFGSSAEATVMAILKAWSSVNSSEDTENALAVLDSLKMWRKLSLRLMKAVPLHKIRDVIRELERRLK